jgi:hypothetical protein
MKRATIIIFAVTLSVVHGQDFKKYYSLVWDFNAPISNRELISKSTLRSGRFIYRETINNRFSVGGDIGFATYHDHLPPDVYTSGNNSLYAEVFPFAYNYTFTFSGEYYYLDQDRLKAFAGIGIGASYNKFTAYYNVFSNEDKTWGALFRPNTGVLVRLGKKWRWAGRIAFHLDYATNKSTDFDYKNFINAGLDAGFALMLQ